MNILVADAHGFDHCARGEVIRKIIRKIKQMKQKEVIRKIKQYYQGQSKQNMSKY